MAKKIYMICLTTITVICMITGVCLYVFMPELYEEVIPERVACEKISFNQIVVNVINTDVEIKQGNEYKVSYICNKMIEEAQIDVSGKILKISHMHTDELTPCKMVISLPGDTMKSTMINVVEGKVDINKLHSEKLVISVDIGDICVIDSVSNDAVLSTSTGDIDIEGMGLFQINASTSYGDIRIDTNDINTEWNLNMKCEYGKIHYNDIVAANKYEHYTPYSRRAVLKTKVGNIYFDANIEKN